MVDDFISLFLSFINFIINLKYGNRLSKSLDYMKVISASKLKTPKSPKAILTKKKQQITQDKTMDKDEILIWLNNYITENKSLKRSLFQRNQSLFHPYESRDLRDELRIGDCLLKNKLIS